MAWEIQYTNLATSIHICCPSHNHTHIHIQNTHIHKYQHIYLCVTNDLVDSLDDEHPVVLDPPVDALYADIPLLSITHKIHVNACKIETIGNCMCQVWTRMHLDVRCRAQKIVIKHRTCIGMYANIYISIYIYMQCKYSCIKK